ncbi:hypothetical protein ABZX60_09690 [Streptomyces olivaceus]|uniref:hypothetical protein n=1 Tax=Streptomyces TaxID=1883 RepID=UPI0021DAEE0A|nr:hypothetical protein [Streptomyces sp. A13(2022)]MCU8592290.1 hypothetical protein [Streptomyces sp. A13(2022)]
MQFASSAEEAKAGKLDRLLDGKGGGSPEIAQGGGLPAGRIPEMLAPVQPGTKVSAMPTRRRSAQASGGTGGVKPGSWAGAQCGQGALL